MCQNWSANNAATTATTTSSSSSNGNAMNNKNDHDDHVVNKKTLENKKGNAAVKHHPKTMDEFYMKHPSFIWGPILVCAILYGVTTHVPMVVTYLSNNDMTYFGFTSALQYTIYAIVTSYAFHGFCCTHASSSLKIQASESYEIKPDAMAVRSTAALLTELVYTFVPLSPNTTSMAQFIMWTTILSVYWDFHFYFAHRFAHENKAAYRFFHKTHHLCKEPNCFGAYFVTYQSHIILEQLVVFILAAVGLPRNVFIFSMYWGTIATYVEHCGFELGTMKLPLVPVSFGQLSSILGFGVGMILDGVTVAEHDWHHEKFFDNYSLSYKYLDKIFGTYHPGREAGTGEIQKVN